MDKLERLLNLTAALLNTDRPLTAEDLRARVGGYPDEKSSFRRTFERDKDDLRSMGVPLRVEVVPGIDPPIDGYRIDREEYAGGELHFEPDELAALNFATNLVRLDGDETALVKLGAAGGSPAKEQVGRVPFPDALATLISAAADRQAVSFIYNGAERTVEPWRLSFSRGHWYLSGWDRARAADRLYRVDRLGSDVTLAGEAVEPVGSIADPLDLRSWELGDGPAVEATVRVDPDQAAFAQHILGDVSLADDGSLTATLQVRNVEAFRSFVLSFLEHAEVIGPPQIHADFIAWLEAQT